MGLQDLTPQLRTRLGRVERMVGIFVSLATLLMIVGFAYYVYHLAERKGWFKTKVVYSTSLNNAAGLKEGDDVVLMGFKVGTILEVKPNEPGEWYGVTVYFNIIEPYYGYIWQDSKVRVAAADLLGKRNLEIIKGQDGQPTIIGKTKKELQLLDSDLVQTKIKEARESLKLAVAKENPGFNAHALQMEVGPKATIAVNALIKEQRAVFYHPLATAKPYWMEPQESPALTERLETVVTTLETAMPNILNLTNQLSSVLNNASSATAKLDGVLESARPLITNFVVITEHLKEPKGSLGDWLLPTNLNAQLNQTLGSADTTLISVQTNLTSVVTNLNATLENLSNVTSNLNAQVQTNSNILSSVSKAVVDADDLVQGLKRHWFLRSAFKSEKEDKEVERKPQTRK